MCLLIGSRCTLAVLAGAAGAGWFDKHRLQSGAFSAEMVMHCAKACPNVSASAAVQKYGETGMSPQQYADQIELRGVPFVIRYGDHTADQKRV